MTTPSPAQMGGKMRQLDNDVQSIYELLAGIASTLVRHGNRLDESDSKLAGIAGTQARHGNRLDELDGKLDEMDTRLTGRLDSMDGKLDTVITMLGDGR